MKKKVFACVLALALAFSIIPYQAFATEIEKSGCDIQPLSDSSVLLHVSNLNVEESPDGGVFATFDLVKSQNAGPDSRAIIGWQIVGYGQVKCGLIPDNGIGDFDWTFELTNGDFIKGVSGTFVLERATSTRNIAKKKVDSLYSVGSLYTRASGSESFSLDPKLARDLRVRFKWSNFKIQGIDDDYSVTNGSIVGDLQDFCI